MYRVRARFIRKELWSLAAFLHRIDRITSGMIEKSGEKAG